MDLKSYFDFDGTQSAKTTRVSYPNTGFVFYLTRCKDKKAFAKHVITKKLEKAMHIDDVPVGKCYKICTNTLPGVIPEAVNGLLCEIHIVVLAAHLEKDADDSLPALLALRRQELRHWRHEIGHAADFAKSAMPVILSSIDNLVDQAELGMTDTIEYRVTECPAMVTELLCEVVDLAFDATNDGKLIGAMSGFESLFQKWEA